MTSITVRECKDRLRMDMIRPTILTFPDRVIIRQQQEEEVTHSSSSIQVYHSYLTPGMSQSPSPLSRGIDTNIISTEWCLVYTTAVLEVQNVRQQ